MAWIAVSESGISKPYFAQQHQAVTEKIYLNKCIKARLIPFIETYHSKEKVLFWPDLRVLRVRFDGGIEGVRNESLRVPKN